jgi:hypothetical protein
MKYLNLAKKLSATKQRGFNTDFDSEGLDDYNIHT